MLNSVKIADRNSVGVLDMCVNELRISLKQNIQFFFIIKEQMLNSVLCGLLCEMWQPHGKCASD